MKLTGILLLVISGLLLLCIPLSMVWTFRQVADSPSPPKPSDLAAGISHSYVFGIWALPIALVGLVLLALGIVCDLKRARPPDREED